MNIRNLQPLELPEAKKSDAYSNIDPLDGRYFDAEIARYLSEEARVRYQAYVEAALARALAIHGVCSESVFDEIESASRTVTAQKVAEEEQITRHDVKALVNVIKRNVSDEAKPFVHFMATSNDIVNTAANLQYQHVMKRVVAPQLKTLILTLIAKAEEYKATAQIGRTHGQHAVPITFGYALAEYVDRLGGSYERLIELTEGLPGKFSGAVGAYNAHTVFVDDPKAFELTLLESVGLKPARYATQIIAPEHVMRVLDELSVTAGIMANLATDMRHLQRSEIAEVREEFSADQAGSSTMAHKRNPVSFENVASLFKQSLGQITSAKFNLVSEHQRDLTDSAAARFYPVLFASVNTMARRLNKTMERIGVNEEMLEKNLDSSGGAIAAEPLYLFLAKSGLAEAHEVAKEMSQTALDSHTTLLSQMASDERTAELLGKLSDREKSIFENPRENYRGLATEQTEDIIAHWRQRLTDKA